MTYYIKNGDKYSTSAEAALDIHNELPVGNYTIGQDMYGNFFFQVVDSFSLPKKRYGDNTRHCERIFNTFIKRNSATGVLLAGEKGSGNYRCRSVGLGSGSGSCRTSQDWKRVPITRPVRLGKVE